MALAIFMALVVFWGPQGLPRAHGQDIHLPIVGRQFLVLGAEARTGAIVDYGGDDLDYSPTLGPRLRLGLHHIITDRLSVNGEIAFGASHFAANPLAPGGQSDAQFALDWGLAAVGRYFPVASRRGLTFAAGLQYRSTALSAGNLLQMGIDARIGWRLWTSDERFFLLELGLHMPFVEGLSLDNEFLVDETTEPIPSEWVYPAATLGAQWAF